MRAKDLPALTSLRFFAAASIVLFHLQGPILGVEPRTNFALGVSFFFVLSGFILTYNYAGLEPGSLRSFFTARFARLFPVHLVTFLLAAVLLFPPRTFLQGASLVTIPFNLTLTQAWLPLNGLVFSWNAVSWSLSAELYFYLLFPFLARSRSLWSWCIALLLLALGMVTLVHLKSALSAQPGMFEFDGMHALLQFPPSRVFEFAVGVLAGRAFNAGDRLRGNPTLLEAASLLLLTLCLLASDRIEAALLAAGREAFAVWLDQAGCVFAFAFLIYIIGSGRAAIGRVLSHPFLVLLGKMSFATYMVHQIIIRFAIQNEWRDALGIPLTAGAIVVLAVASSWVVWALVEEPARLWITRRWGGGAASRQRSAAAVSTFPTAGVTQPAPMSFSRNSTPEI